MTVQVKICGLRSDADVTAAAEAGAAYGGFVFYGKSKRSVTFAQARGLARNAPVGLAKVGLLVDAENAYIDTLLREVPLDILQLHGSEPPERVAELRARHGLPVMKAIGIRSAEDLPQIDRYAQVADILLLDAKPPQGDVPGGAGVPFDWRLIQRKYWTCPWMLAGGLTESNVSEAVRMTGARAVDLSSGVESAPGVKDPALIRSFVTRVHSL